MSTAILAAFAYELFAGFFSNYAQNAMRARAIELSAMERKLFHSNTPLSALFTFFALVVRINGIAFLIYLGYKTVWYHPILIWVLAAIISGLILGVAKRSLYGSSILALIGLIAAPIISFIMWQSL